MPIICGFELSHQAVFSAVFFFELLDLVIAGAQNETTRGRNLYALKMGRGEKKQIVGIVSPCCANIHTAVFFLLYYL